MPLLRPCKELPTPRWGKCPNLLTAENLISRFRAASGLGRWVWTSRKKDGEAWHAPIAPWSELDSDLPLGPKAEPGTQSQGALEALSSLMKH